MATPLETALIAFAAAVLALIAYHGALRYGFSQDDFLGLARAQGLAPRLSGPWRILANQWFWDVGLRLFGLSARPFHCVVLAAHAATCALLGIVLARRCPAPAAFVAAAIYATHPAHQGALYWISANSEPFMTLGVLATAVAFGSRGRRRRWLALPAFAVALAWKETALLLPLALACNAWLGPPPHRPPRELARDPVLLALLAIAAAWAVGIAAFMGGLSTAGNAYEASLRAVPANLLTYASWVPSCAGWLQRDSSDGVRPVFVAMGEVVTALALFGLLWRPWRARGAGGGLLAGLLLLVPVLPLAHHTYHYYLLAPLAPLSFPLAALFAAATARLSRAARWAVALAVAAVLVSASATWVRMLETEPFEFVGSHADRTIDRAVIAANAIADLRAAGHPQGGRLVMWSPSSQAFARQLGRDPAAETYEERNVRAALLDGLALRVMVPGIDSVRFVRAFAPAGPDETWGVFRPDGHVGVRSARELAVLITGRPR